MLHIRHANGCILKFGIDEFEILTGEMNSITKNQLVQRFKMGNWENNQDALQMYILFFIHTFVSATLDNKIISIVDFLIVEDGRYRDYP